MRAMVLERPLDARRPMAGKERFLALRDVPMPRPGPRDVLMQVVACGVCRTELDQVEGRIAPQKLPVIVGHQPVGVVAETGRDVTRFKSGDRIGVTWIFSSCGECRFCLSGRENLCEQFQATGCHADGGYAEYLAVSEDFAVRLPDGLSDHITAAPLMCAGAVGYRSLRLTGMEDGMTLGLFGFGSANHLVLQLAGHLFPAARRYVFSRNAEERALALSLGADWAGAIDAEPPGRLDRAIDATPAWQPILRAMERLERGGRLVVNAIRKEPADREHLLGLDFARHLWLEKEIKSVANVTRRDGEELVQLAAESNIVPTVERYALEQANEALADLKAGKIHGSKVLVMGPT